MWKLCDLNAGKSKELKLVFSETLQKIMDENPNVIALEADLGGASSFLNIKKTHPDQFLDVGIAEANMIGTAAGLSMLGYILLSTLFAPLLPEEWKIRFSWPEHILKTRSISIPLIRAYVPPQTEALTPHLKTLHS